MRFAESRTSRVTGNEEQACFRCAGWVLWEAGVSKIRKSSQSDAPKRLIKGGLSSEITRRLIPVLGRPD